MSIKSKFRMFLRGTVYWFQDNETGVQKTLGTRDRRDAERLLHAKNEAHRQPMINRQLAAVYMGAADSEAQTRTWQAVMNEIVKLKKGETERRWLVAIKDRALDGLRGIPLFATRPEHLLRAMEKGKVSTNIYLRRIHNFAVGMNWLPCSVIPKRLWPAFEFKEKRAITLKEHQALIAREENPERRAFYELAWHLGASQSDIAFLEADNIDWENKVVSYARKKSGELASVRFGDAVEDVLRSLPEVGALFPSLRKFRPCDRATEFKKRCLRVGITGVSLHSYRYAWAERARKAGYPERFAQEALGHNSKAVHRAYAKKAKVITPTLESYEKGDGKLIELPAARGEELSAGG